MLDFFSDQIDYIFYIYGFCLFLIAVISIALAHKGNRAIPWVWLSLFMALRGLAQWLTLLTEAFPGSSSIIIRFYITLASYLCFTEFLRQGLRQYIKNIPGIWAYIPLSLTFILITKYGGTRMESIYKDALVLPGSLLGSYTFYLASCTEWEDSDRNLRKMAVLYLFYGFLSIATAWKVELSPLTLSLENRHLGIDGLMHLIRGIATFFTMILTFSYYMGSRMAINDLIFNRRRRRIGVISTILLLLTFSTGWVFTYYLGKDTDNDFRDELLSKASICSGSLNAEQVKLLNESQGSLHNSTFLSLQSLLYRMRSADPSCSYIYLMGFQNRKVIFLVEGEPAPGLTKYGEVYSEASPQLIHAFSTGKPFVEGPLKDHWGNWVTGFAPINDPHTGKLLAFLGVDVDSSSLVEERAKQRLDGIIATFLFSLLAITLVYIYQTNSLIASSEELYRMLVQGSPDCIELFDKYGKRLAINEIGLKTLGCPERDAIGKGILEKWPVPSQKKLLNGMKHVLNGKQSAFDADWEGPGNIKLTRHVVLNPVLYRDGKVAQFVVVSSDITERTQIERALRRSEAQNRAILEAIPDLMFVIRADGTIIESIDSQQGTRLSRSSFRGKHLSQVFETSVARFTLQNIRRALESREPQIYEHQITLDGRQRDYEARMVSCAENEVLVLLRDITERKQTERDLHTRSSAVNASQDHIIITDAIGAIEYVNPALERDTGYKLSELIGKPPAVFSSGRYGEDFYDHIWQVINSGDTWHGELINQRKDGSIYVVDAVITPVTNEYNEVVRFVAIERNITDKKEYEKQLQYLAHHDLLTNLPNRLLFLRQLSEKIKLAGQNQGMLAVMFLDLDRFKVINDTLGHRTGDELLKVVSSRLARILREGDIIARMGGDEFTIILSSITSAKDPEIVARRLLESLTRPFVLEGREFFVTSSIGISLYPSDGIDAETLVKNADSAMYRAKERGKNCFEFYMSHLNERGLERITLESALHRALDYAEFQLYYQPKVSLETGKLEGMEALFRWNHPMLGMVTPLDVIPLAEEIGLIIPIGEWILREACNQARSWQDQYPTPFSISVNISPIQLQHPSFIDMVLDAQASSGIDPNTLELEITENTLMQNPEHAVEVMNQLKKKGIRFSIDDFGTGHSSLSYLKRFPVDVIKIDRMFIHHLNEDTGDAAITQAIIAMAHSLKLDVVAEGVETYDQFDSLRSLKCNLVQGYLVSEPVPAEEFPIALLKGDSFDTEINKVI